METERFDELVREAMAGIDPVFQKYLEEVPVIVEDRPDAGVCHQFGRGARRSLLGLFRGVPLNRRSVQSPDGPNQIILYRRNLLAISRDQQELAAQIRKTLIHELGHYVGFSESQLHKYLE